MKRNLFSLVTLLTLFAILASSCTPQPTAAPAVQPTTPPAASSANTAVPAAPAKQYTIGLSNFSLGNSWRVQMVAEAQYAAKNNPAVKELIVTEADDSVEKQIADIEDLITKKVDAILITAINPDALVPVVDKAMEAGIVVVDFDNLVDTTNITANILVDQKEFGKVQATWLVKAIGGKGDIIAFNGMNGTQISADRFAGAKAVFDQYPDIKIVDTVNADWDYAKAKTAMESLMTTYPNIAGVWSQGGAMSQAVIQAYLEKGKTPPPVTGEDGNGFLKLWKSLRTGKYPTYDSISTSMPTWVSAQAMEVALKALNKQAFEKDTLLPIPTITADTLDQYVRPNLSDSFWCNSHLPDDVVNQIFPATETTTAQPTEAAKPSKQYTIGLSNFSLGNSWRVQMVAEAQYAAKNNPAVKELIVTEADDSVEKQIADIEDLITKKVDAILITAINPDALVPVVDKAMEAGIVVVDFDNLVDTTNITANILVDQKEFGKVQATWLVKAIGGKGDIIAFNGMNGTQISADRFAGAKAVFDQYPDIKIVDTVNADWDYAKAKTAMESLMTTYPNIAGVWSQGGAMSQAVIQAYLEKGKTPPPVTGEDGNGFLKLWKSLRTGKYPTYDSISTSMPTWVSAQAMEVALKALNKQAFEKDTLLPIPTITADTLDQYVRPNLSDSFWCNSHLPDEVVKELFPQ